VEGSPDEPFDVIDSVGWVEHRLVLCSLPDQPPVRGEGNHGGCDAVPLFVLNDFDFAVFVDPDAAVSGAEVNANRRTLTLDQRINIIGHSDGVCA